MGFYSTGGITRPKSLRKGYGKSLANLECGDHERACASQSPLWKARYSFKDCRDANEAIVLIAARFNVFIIYSNNARYKAVTETRKRARGHRTPNSLPAMF